MRLATDCRPAMVLTLLYVGRREGLGHERTRPTTNAGYEPGAREKWMRILFVHPEGNLANNPNLSAMIELLTRAGHEIILRSRRGSFARHENPNVTVLEVRYRIQRKLMQLSCHPRKWFLGKLLITLVPPMTPPADLVVGVDRQGLIEGAVIARSKGIPLAYWSYEIFFTTESSSNFKALERREASSVRFAVAQDDLRARLLSEETGIPNDRILRIPVAGTGTRPAARTRYLNKRFGIPADRRIAIFAGSVDEWTLARPLVESLPLWPENWVLVMHHRYGYVSDWQRSARHRMPSRFYLSEDSFPTIEGLGHMLHGADLGIALYNPTYDTPWTGRNIANIGMSSGKIATYMQYGLPVLINELGEISSHVREKGLGAVQEMSRKSLEFCATSIPSRCAAAAWPSLPST